MKAVESELLTQAEGTEEEGDVRDPDSGILLEEWRVQATYKALQPWGLTSGRWIFLSWFENQWNLTEDSKVLRLYLLRGYTHTCLSWGQGRESMLKIAWSFSQLPTTALVHILAHTSHPPLQPSCSGAGLPWGEGCLCQEEITHIEQSQLGPNTACEQG